MASSIQDLNPLIELGIKTERAERHRVEEARARLRELFYGFVIARGGKMDQSDVDAEMFNNRWYLTWAVDSYTLEMINESYIVHNNNGNYSFVIDGNGTYDIMDVKWCIRNHTYYLTYNGFGSVSSNSEIRLFKTAEALRWVKLHPSGV